jgi:H+/Cl- antiporter ClcA
MWLEWLADLVEVILGGLAAGTFGVAFAEMSAQAATIEDHYKSLWIPMLLGGLLVAFLACRPPRSDRTW